MRERQRTVKKDDRITSKVDEKLKAAFQETIHAPRAKWINGESNFVRTCAEALIEQISNGEELAQPLRFLTVEQRRTLDAIAFQRRSEEAK